MTNSSITLEATLHPDGVTLQLDKKAAMSPGRVMVTVHAVWPQSGPTMLEVLDRIHQDQQRRGRRPMTEEEMDLEIAAIRGEDNEAEQRWRQIWSETRQPPQPTDQP